MVKDKVMQNLNIRKEMWRIWEAVLVLKKPFWRCSYAQLVKSACNMGQLAYKVLFSLVTKVFNIDGKNLS